MVAYLAVRPTLAAATPYLLLIEFPTALVLLALVAGLLVRRSRADAPAPVAATPWRRHEQVVRALPDPEIKRLRDPLDGWLADGSRLDEASRVVALAASRAGAGDAHDGALESRVRERMAQARGRRRRESALRSILSSAQPSAPKTRSGA